MLEGQDASAAGRAQGRRDQGGSDDEAAGRDLGWPTSGSEGPEARATSLAMSAHAPLATRSRSSLEAIPPNSTQVETSGLAGEGKSILKKSDKMLLMKAKVDKALSSIQAGSPDEHELLKLGNEEAKKASNNPQDIDEKVIKLTKEAVEKALATIEDKSKTTKNKMDVLTMIYGKAYLMIYDITYDITYKADNHHHHHDDHNDAVFIIVNMCDMSYDICYYIYWQYVSQGRRPGPAVRQQAHLADGHPRSRKVLHTPRSHGQLHEPPLH